MSVCLCVTPVYLLTGRGRMSLWLLCQILVACFFPALFWWRIVLPTQLTMPNVLYEIWLVRFACPRSNNMLCGLQKKKKSYRRRAILTFEFKWSQRVDTISWTPVCMPYTTIHCGASVSERRWFDYIVIFEAVVCGDAAFGRTYY